MSKIPLTHANIIELLGIESLPTDQKKEILNLALELVETETLNRIIEMVEGEDRSKLLDLIEKSDVNGLGDFFNEKQINLLKITEEETEKVKKMLLKEVVI